MYADRLLQELAGSTRSDTHGVLEHVSNAELVGGPGCPPQEILAHI